MKKIIKLPLKILKLVLSPITHFLIPTIFRFINKRNPPTKIAFALNLGLVGGTEKVFQKHVSFASEKYDCDVFFNIAKGPIADELRKKFRVKAAKTLSYHLLRYKYIYLAQTFPNIRYIKQANPYARVSFILHEHLSGWLETFQESPDTILIDHIFCISNLVRNKFLKKVPSYPEERVTVLYNPFSNGNNDISKIENKNIDPQKFVIGYLGRVSPEKNTIGLVRIFKKINKIMPNTKLVIAGPIYDHLQEYKELFLKEISENPNIEYLGPIGGVGQMSPEEFFGKIDGLAFSSFIEGIALTATEAMSYGLPVISTNVGAQSEIIKENITGMLVDIKPIKFNPFKEVKPPFQFLDEEDEDLYVQKLEKFVKTNWNQKEIAKYTIENFGDESAKKRLLEGIDQILSKEPVLP